MLHTLAEILGISARVCNMECGFNFKVILASIDCDLIKYPKCKFGQRIEKQQNKGPKRTSEGLKFDFMTKL